MKKELKSISMKKVEGGSELTIVEFIPSGENLEKYIQEKVMEYNKSDELSNMLQMDNFSARNFSARGVIVPYYKLRPVRSPHITAGNIRKIAIKTRRHHLSADPSNFSSMESIFEIKNKEEIPMRKYSRKVPVMKGDNNISCGIQPIFSNIFSKDTEIEKRNESTLIDDFDGELNMKKIYGEYRCRYSYKGSEGYNCKIYTNY